MNLQSDTLPLLGSSDYCHYALKHSCCALFQHYTQFSRLLTRYVRQFFFFCLSSKHCGEQSCSSLLLFLGCRASRQPCFLRRRLWTCAHCALRGTTSRGHLRTGCISMATSPRGVTSHLLPAVWAATSRHCDPLHLSTTGPEST